MLNEIGIQLTEVRVIRDEEDVIVETVNHLRKTYDYVFTTGGIGPTHDDITSESIAKAFSVDLEINQGALSILKEYYKDGELTEARMKMTKCLLAQSSLKIQSVERQGLKWTMYLFWQVYQELCKAC